MHIFYLLFYNGLANRTTMISSCHDNVIYLSICPSICDTTVAKWYILEQKCHNKWIWNCPPRNTIYNFQSLHRPHPVMHHRHCCHLANKSKFKTYLWLCYLFTFFVLSPLGLNLVYDFNVTMRKQYDRRSAFSVKAALRSCYQFAI